MCYLVNKISRTCAKMKLAVQTAYSMSREKRVMSYCHARSKSESRRGSYLTSENEAKLTAERERTLRDRMKREWDLCNRLWGRN